MAMGGGGFRKGEMNVTPLIDVLLVLIIIFLVIRPPYPTGFDANAPQSDASTDQQARQDIVVTARGDGTVLVNQETVELANLQARFRELFKTHANGLIFVRGGEGVNYQEVAHVIDLAKGAGIKRFGLMPRAVH